MVPLLKFETLRAVATSLSKKKNFWSPANVLACDGDQQCRGAMCCAVSLWLRSLRICTPMGNEGDECHPLSHKVPYFGRRMHHTCPCLPDLICVRVAERHYKCLPQFKIEVFS
ncbi:toxin MIT1-like [Narcine bancroftii]|uniref:toxin MIT1-like n=1 Tax=Narcine bancroftii TaxID=1343680 RepID=UPI0038320640